MPYLELTSSGNYDQTEAFLNSLRDGQAFSILEHYARIGVDILSAETPFDSGQTAASWGYEIEKKNGIYSIIFTNSHVVDGLPIAILIQYGHGTGTGGWVEGRDYINPAIQPLFDVIANDIWERMKRV